MMPLTRWHCVSLRISMTPISPITNTVSDAGKRPRPYSTGSRFQRCPAPAERAAAPPTDHASAQEETPRMSWARLLKRVFDIDVEHCPNCGGALKIIAAIDDPPVIIKILSHLGLPTRGPPRRAPARRVDLFQTI
jgi:hypothetical protein